MQKFKMFLVVCIVAVFALFIGLQSRDFGSGNFTKAFLITLIFGLAHVIIITVCYIAGKVVLVKNGSNDNFANPLDIWLLTIPMVVLMIVAYLLLRWHVAEVFFCTTISLSGMLFANNLGRGSGKWRIEKSLPFFIGCIITIVYGIVIGGAL